MEDLKGAGSDSWETAKQGTDLILEDLQLTCEEIVDRFAGVLK